MPLGGISAQDTRREMSETQANPTHSAWDEKTVCVTTQGEVRLKLSAAEPRYLLPHLFLLISRRKSPG